mgnify:CR=1 FL=1
MDKIIIKNARENNLKGIDLELPKNKLIVMTGVSGSGKSSLAFDTIYAEGQRRYVESLSSYARQFLGGTSKPDVDSIEGLSPSISIDQKTTSNNPRSTVGTVTEIYDYFRLLYARIGKPMCPTHHIPIKGQSIEEMTNKIMEYDIGTKIIVLSPCVHGEKGTHKELLEKLKLDGYIRIRVNGEMVDLTDDINFDKNIKDDIDVVVDRLVIKEDVRGRLFEALEKAKTIEERNTKFAGIPIGIKDNMCITGTKTTCASKILENFVAPYNATVINRLTDKITEVVEALKAAGAKFEGEIKEKGSALEGLSICITGTLPTLSRNEAADLIIANGGKVVGSVSKKTSYLLMGEAAGSKADKAKSLGIPTLSEEDILKMLE